MPGATLTIERNVEVHIWPNVRILVLGNFIADGTLWQPIRFKPINATEFAEQHGRVGTRYRRSTSRRTNIRRSKDAKMEVENEFSFFNDDEYDSTEFWSRRRGQPQRNADTLWWKRYRRRDRRHDIDARFISFRSSINKKLAKKKQK